MAKVPKSSERSVTDVRKNLRFSVVPDVTLFQSVDNHSCRTRYTSTTTSDGHLSKGWIQHTIVGIQRSTDGLPTPLARPRSRYLYVIGANATKYC